MLTERVDTAANRADLKSSVLLAFEDYLKNRFKANNPMLAFLATDGMVKQIMQKLDEMLDELIPGLFNKVTGKIEALDMEGLVEQRVLNFSDQKFEDLLMGVISKELGFIEMAGAVLGFFIGLVQVSLVLLSRYFEGA